MFKNELKCTNNVIETLKSADTWKNIAVREHDSRVVKTF